MQPERQDRGCPPAHREHTDARLPAPRPGLSHILPEKKGRLVFVIPTAHKSTEASCRGDSSFLPSRKVLPSPVSPPPKPTPRLPREPRVCPWQFLLCKVGDTRLLPAQYPNTPRAPVSLRVACSHPHVSSGISSVD